MPPNRKGAVGAAPFNGSLGCAEPCTIVPRRRNGHKAGSQARRDALAALGGAGVASVGGSDAPRGELVNGASLLLADGATARDAWVAWLAPVFAGSQACYFTGTYSDDYGLSNGLMLARNVHKDFRRFLESFDFDRRYIVGVEQHLYRDILHLHGILEGPFTSEQMRWVKQWWSVERGHARALPVLDGCASYVTKYALKGDTDSFEWRLS